MGHVIERMRSGCKHTVNGGLMADSPDTTTHKSRTNRRKIFKLDGWIDHMTRNVWHCLRSKGQGRVTYQQQQRYNSAANSRNKFKLSEH